MAFKVRVFYRTASGLAFGDKAFARKADAEKLYRKMREGIGSERVVLYGNTGAVVYDWSRAAVAPAEGSNDDTCPF